MNSFDLGMIKAEFYLESFIFFMATKKPKLVMIRTTVVPHHKLVNPNCAATRVPINGEKIKASEKDNALTAI